MPLADAAGPGRGARSLYRSRECDRPVRLDASGGEPMLKFEDPNKGPRRLLTGHEQDLAKASVSSSIGSSLFCILPARSPKNAPGPGLKRLRRDHQSISEFVTSRPATTISRRRLSMVAVASRVRGHGASSGRPVLCEVACWRCRIRIIVALGRRRFAS